MPPGLRSIVRAMSMPRAAAWSSGRSERGGSFGSASRSCWRVIAGPASWPRQGGAC